MLYKYLLIMHSSPAVNKTNTCDVGSDHELLFSKAIVICIEFLIVCI